MMREATPQYRIIFNWDGAPMDYDEHPQSTERLMEQVYGPLEGTQVDAMFWSIGSHEAEWPSEVHERLGDGEGRVYKSMRAMRHSENVRSMFERGENPFQAMVDRGHELGMAVYVSMRMNDNHFYGTRPEDFKRLNRGTKFRQDHPEWLLDVGDVPEQRGIGSWNMAIPEAKEHKLSYIREACLQADWDGVELDWQRHPFHVPDNYGYRLRYALTDLQRAVRRMADEIAEQRGRPFYVAARVATTLESCRNIGYDVERWVEEDLADIIIGAGGSATDPGFEVGEFKALTEGTNIRLYGGFDSIYRQKAERLISHDEWRDAWLRAVATGYYNQGRGRDIHVQLVPRQGAVARPADDPRLARHARGEEQALHCPAQESDVPRRDLAERGQRPHLRADRRCAVPVDYAGWPHYRRAHL